MSISIKVTNRTRQVLVQVGKLGSLTKKSIKTALFDIGNDLKQTAVDDIMHTPKHGRRYKIKLKNGKRIIHIASRAGSSGAGEAPANIDETLANSVGYKVHSSTELYFGAGNSKAYYAPFLELGTKYIEKRQYLIKSINTNARNICTRVQNQIQKDLKNTK